MAGEGGLAKQVRTGLDSASAKVVALAPKSTKIDPLDELSFNKPIREHVREFGVLFAAICFGFGAIRGYRHESLNGTYILSALGVVFLTLGYLAPRILHPVWKAWMAFAHYLSIVMTFVVMSVTWVVAFVPMALFLKILGIKRIDQSFGGKTDSYWEKRDPKHDNFALLERQF